MHIGVFVILYRFLNQCLGNLARGIVPFVSAYMQNFMLISATIKTEKTKKNGSHIVVYLRQKSLFRFICNNVTQK